MRTDWKTEVCAELGGKEHKFQEIPKEKARWEKKSLKGTQNREIIEFAR